MNIQKYPIKIKFYKKGEMIYFSQLDIFHVLERALRRTDLSIYVTKGFNPHVKISFSNGLKLGVEGEIEATLYFDQETSYETLKQKLSAQLPEGFDIIP
ncbi:MAG: TIGR03936 family radical SAM-associated protein [Candidatus Omnitrophica bacterium]|nr:TIGR03936 family radical SAM-associated protein [Candidatus Omnitrophota bacterium]